MWAIRLAVGAVALALLVAGWFLHDLIDSGPPDASIEIDRPVQVVQEGILGTDQMPSILGLDEASARQTLVDAGIDLAGVTTTDAPYVGSPGLVVQQDPSAGDPIEADTKVELSLSAPGDVPDLAGLNEDDARSRLLDLGVQVSVATTFDAEATEGTVLDTEPAAGEALRQRMTLVVAEPESSVFLSQLRAVDGGCRTGEARVAGEDFANSLSCAPKPHGAAGSASYVIDERLSTLRATVGLDDAGATDGPADFEVLVDGESQFEVTLDFGVSKEIEVPITGGHQLTLLAEAPASSGTRPAVPVFADARLDGGQSVVDELVAGVGP